MGLIKEDSPLLNNFFTTRVDAFINWGRKNSVWPMPMGLSCCAIEMMAMVASRYDLARFGAEALRFSPRQADLLLVAGTLTRKMAPAAVTVYNQMPEPKWVLGMGACVISGGMFDSYSVVQGIDDVIPVDVYVPGCPPRPESVIYAVMKIQALIETESPLKQMLADEPANPEKRFIDKQLENVLEKRWHRSPKGGKVRQDI